MQELKRRPRLQFRQWKAILYKPEPRPGRFYSEWACEFRLPTGETRGFYLTSPSVLYPIRQFVEPTGVDLDNLSELMNNSKADGRWHNVYR